MTFVLAHLAQTAVKQAPGPRDVDRMAAASETLVYFFGAMVVALVVAWVILAVVKHRYFASPRIAAGERAKGKAAGVKDAWAEAGRRMQVEPGPDQPDQQQ